MVVVIPPFKKHQSTDEKHVDFRSQSVSHDQWHPCHPFLGCPHVTDIGICFVHEAVKFWDWCLSCWCGAAWRPGQGAVLYGQRLHKGVQPPEIEQRCWHWDINLVSVFQAYCSSFNLCFSDFFLPGHVPLDERIHVSVNTKKTGIPVLNRACGLKLERPSAVYI